MYGADEAFVTGTFAGLTPVISIDGKTIGNSSNNEMSATLEKYYKISQNSNKMSKVICLWASPRNISTALMYSFAQRSDVKVLDEPFYAHYLKI